MKKRIEQLENEKSDLEHSLEQLDVDCQQSIDKLVTLKDNLQTDYNRLEEELTYLKEENKKLLSIEKRTSKERDLLRKQLEETQTSTPSEHENQTKYDKLQDEIFKLQTELENVKKIRDELEKSLQNANDECKSEKEKAQAGNSELKQKWEELMKQNREFQEQLETLRTENYNLTGVTDNLNSELSVCKNELEKSQHEHSQMLHEMDKIMNENKELIHIKQSFEEYKKESETSMLNLVNHEDYQKIVAELDTHKSQVAYLKEELCNLQAENRKILETQQHSSDAELLISLKQDLSEAKKCLNDIELEKKEMHAKYINILVDSMKKYVDGIVPTEFSPILTEKDPNIAEYTNQVESILKLLLDFKLKTETVEKELYELREEKARIVSEKNHEIEKLLRNSEILSQEVITKSQTVKDFEMECAELIKNNDLLISELDTFKNNSGLQTISESNEDNMVLLESQLENANKRIKDLELTLADLEKHDANLETNIELDYIKRQLNITGTELNQTKLEYLDLLKKYDKLQEVHDVLKRKYSSLETALEQLSQEKEELNVSIDKITSEFENNEYKCTELNIMQDSLKEDVETYKKKYEEMLHAHKEMEALNTEHETKTEFLQSKIENLQHQLLTEKEARSQIELQLRNSIEKLQNTKMTETSLKLQVDTLYKELQSLQDANQNLHSNYQKALSDIAVCHNTIKELEQKNESLEPLVCQFQNLKISNDELVAKNVELLNQLKISEENLKNLENRFTNININDIDTQNGQSVERQNLEDPVEKNIQMLQTLQLNKNGSIDTETSEEMSTSEPTPLSISGELGRSSLNENSVQKLNDDYEEIIAQLKSENLKIPMLEAQITELNTGRNELIAVVTAKHHENIAYHHEIQRLTQLLSDEKERSCNLQLQLENFVNNEDIERKNEEIDKLTDQNNFLRDKCEVLAKNLLQEQSNVQKYLAERATPSDKEQAMAKELERLRAHLVEMEEMYTQELVQAEQKKQELLAKMSELEEREKNSSTLYTSVSIRANQQVESLLAQVQLLTSQRDDLRRQISDAEDENSKQSAALANLQFVLEQFQKGKCFKIKHLFMFSSMIIRGYMNENLFFIYN